MLVQTAEKLILGADNLMREFARINGVGIAKDQNNFKYSVKSLQQDAKGILIELQKCLNELK